MNTPLLQKISLETLNALVTEQGIYASTNKGDVGRYHALFGRDTVITAAFIREAEKNSSQKPFTKLAATGLLKLANWQGVESHEETREEPGKIPHEVWEDSSQARHLVDRRIQAGRKPFYIDFSKPSYMNWFSNDSTPLWVWQVLCFAEDGVITIDDSLRQKILKAVEWCIHNVHANDGFSGYTHVKDGPYYELVNQSWKDSRKALLDEQGNVPEPPIKDVGVNAIMWAALKKAALYFKDDNLTNEADQLKKRFNSEAGFLMKTEDGYYFAEALDKDNKQLKGIASDPAWALWAQVGGECIIEEIYIPDVVKRIMAPDFFDPQAGVRIYSSKNKIFDPESYHRGPNTQWPFVSGIIANGLINFGYKRESAQVVEAMLAGVERFGSCIEMFLQVDGEYVRYIQADTGFESSADQAWTAAVVYWALTLHLH